MNILVFGILFSSLLELFVVQHLTDILDNESFIGNVLIGANTKAFDLCIENAAAGVVVSLELLIIAVF